MSSFITPRKGLDMNTAIANALMGDNSLPVPNLLTLILSESSTLNNAAIFFLLLFLSGSPLVCMVIH